MQPTFSKELPQTTTTMLEFLDHSDPAKDVVVEKKAREWVDKNKGISKQKLNSQATRKPKSPSQDQDQSRKKQQ